MRLEVKVIPKASRNAVKVEGTRLKVFLTAAPEKGKANKALLELLARHFKTKKSDIRITRGEHSALKTIEVCSTP